MVNVRLEYQGITRTTEIQDDFFNDLDKYMIDKTYNKLMIQRSEGMRRIIVDSDDDYVDDENPLFGLINCAHRCGIYLHVNTTKKRRNNICDRD